MASAAKVGCVHCLGFGNHCLKKISKSYNLTHYLNHAQPMRGNQIVSGRNIWIANGRPTNKAIEAKTHRYGAVHDFEAYTVSPSSADWEDVIYDLRIL